MIMINLGDQNDNILKVSWSSDFIWLIYKGANLWINVVPPKRKKGYVELYLPLSQVQVQKRQISELEREGAEKFNMSKLWYNNI